MRSLLASINCSANSTGLLKMPGSKRSRRSATTTWRSAACRRYAPITPEWRRNSPSTRLQPLDDCGLGCRPVSDPGGPAFRSRDGRGHRHAPVRLRRLGRYRQHRRASRGCRSAQSRARVRDDRERAGKRLQLRWSTQDRHQGRPRAGGAFRKSSPLTVARIFRSGSYFIKGINPTRTWASSGKVLLRLEQQMRRREFITLLGGAAVAWPFPVRAQQPPTTVKQARVGVLAVSPPTPAMLNAFREGMRERGYIEGQNLSIDVRWSQGTFEQISALAAELVSANVQVIIAWATPSVIAARRATSVIPIVMVSVGDPVGSGFVTSLARPGGNITGFSGFTADLSAKLMALFVELVPNIKRVGIVSNSYNPNVMVQLWETEDAVHKLGLQSQVVEARTPEEFERAFARLSMERVHGVVLLADPSVIEQAKKIAELAQAARLPTAFQRRENVEAGGLMSYGGNIQYQFRQAAIHVDRILKGAKPADLPVEQPTKFELVVNLSAAKALGLSIPESFLSLADEVIE